MPISSRELKHFLSNAFVECGSASGLGISSALAAGFPAVYSVEIDPDNYAICQTAFKDFPQVHLANADCGKWLGPTLQKIDQPCTVYLDANGWKHEVESPFHSSVRSMLSYGENDHLLLVDDINHGMRERKELLRDLRTSDMVWQLRRINPDYHFYLIDTQSEDGTTTYPSWVLVADLVKDRFPNTEYV